MSISNENGNKLGRLLKLIMLIVIGCYIVHFSTTMPLKFYLSIMLFVIIVSLELFHYIGKRTFSNITLALLFVSTTCLLLLNAFVVIVYYVSIAYYFFPIKQRVIRNVFLVAHFLGYLVYVLLGSINWGYSSADMVNLVYALFAYFGILAMEMQMYNNQAEQKRLQVQNKELIAYSVQETEYLKSEERKKISQHLHDTLGHSMMALLMNVRFLKEKTIRGTTISETDFIDIEKMIKDVVDNVRSTVDHLKILETKINLKSELTKLEDRFNKLEIIHISVSYANEVENIPNKIKNTLYQTITEGVTNAISHGNAKRIEISVWLKNSSVFLNLWDNGKGCKNIVPSHGLNGITDRILQLGGQVDFDNTRQFSISCQVPLEDYDD